MKKVFMELRVFYRRGRKYIQDKRVANYPRFEALRRQFYEELWKSTTARMGAEIQDYGHGYYKINLNSHSTFVMQSKVMLDDHLSLRMAGNKPLVHRILSEHRFSIQDYLEFNIHDLPRAYRFMKSRQKPCVVKPAAATGAGNGITTKLRSYAQLRKAAIWAATFSPRLLIEEEIPGDSYRLLYLEGRYIDAIKRNPPQVVGDGRHSIQKLMQLENQKRLQGHPITALSPLVVDYECRLHLRQQGLTLRHVPPKDKAVTVKSVVNQNRFSENESVRDIVHPSIVEAGARIATIFNLQLVGVDLITPDVTQPLEAVGGVINEINTNPGLHHHYLLKDPGQVAPVAQTILEFILTGNFPQGGGS